MLSCFVLGLLYLGDWSVLLVSGGVGAKKVLEFLVQIANRKITYTGRLCHLHHHHFISFHLLLETNLVFIFISHSLSGEDFIINITVLLLLL